MIDRSKTKFTINILLKSVLSIVFIWNVHYFHCRRYFTGVLAHRHKNFLRRTESDRQFLRQYDEIKDRPSERFTVARRPVLSWNWPVAAFSLVGNVIFPGGALETGIFSRTVRWNAIKKGTKRSRAATVRYTAFSPVRAGGESVRCASHIVF